MLEHGIDQNIEEARKTNDIERGAYAYMLKDALIAAKEHGFYDPPLPEEVSGSLDSPVASPELAALEPQLTADYNENHSGTAIRAWRTRLGITQEELADRVGITKGYVSALERGIPNLSERRMLQIANALYIPVIYLALHQLPLEE